MKKIFIALLMAGGLFASCDMDKKPYGSLDDQTAIQTLNDCKRFRNGLYSSMRSITAGSWVNSQEIQMDIFQGIIGNGNQVGTFANGTILSSDQTIESMWSSIYSVINSANYIIEKMEKLSGSDGWSQEQMVELNRYNGEAHFVRAYCYYWLVDHFCETYSSVNAQAPAKGVPLVTVYYPTADRAVYPSRSTQDESYKLIAEDLDVAYTALKAFESGDNVPSANSFYLTSNVVLALQARIALLKGDNTTALSKAEEVIGMSAYSLCSIDKYAAMWSTDESSEVIFRPFMSNSELGSATGGSYFLSANEESAWYIPSYSMLEMYGENDIRFDVFFKIYEKLTSNGTSALAYVFNKFPGNEALKTGAQPNFVNMMKPFRLSEMYLVAAEAAAANNDVTKANKYLNDLRANRIAGYENENLTGNALTQAIRDERLRELIGEGFRLSDLRRWNEGFTRDSSYPISRDVEDFFVNAGKELSYQPGDYRMVWPIPATEIQSNPQLDGQQNPGY
ncbi:RagB/SusD family nutrient uptake outer membrane protein [Bacteroides muris (ex Fokt et al. 2023)]|uniref:RagB/SusD family nutrient uptake outer membrane protein n=1 Tax=Bacteroides muris (ex Fokt et al. 2023) TaxID=2937417 RepID=A0A9X2STH2_9BACE|nr:RagB/SusD family nutrient uptake outer membrane protein [Bacteroides muris (ex Fokt et al. 2023)]MCR6504948.1 RagB/SusD family nutrient uptake outer membrane protein [Bacteroides muris (ex Fokt et al. 2023)]